MNKTLKVLEARIPQFFRGISALYSIKQKVKNRTSGKKKISEKVKNILRQNLTMEYEFYNFICKRLNDQFNLIKKSS
ncbi:uronyl 2-sulfotransferase homolog pip-like [Tachypleus tridentatus]|uniref:uronyl 2-sulfotransferase homolog pip-like n=1 Tax=Tachypleus tridentatus TaxID=6853 RepID=UPI003FCFCD9A